MNDELDMLDLEASMLKVRDNHNRRIRDLEFKSFMSKLNGFTHDQRLELFNALVERLCAGE